MSGRNAPRSKNGCSTCRRRKVKCGEERPVCMRCLNLNLTCEWGVPVKRGRSTQIRHLQPAPTSASDQITWHTSEQGDAVALTPDARLNGLSPMSWPGDSPLVELPQSTSFFPPAAPVPFATPLYPQLSVNEIACANSLTLTEHDQKYFQYFPSSSIVYYYMKGWQWSSFCYLYQGPAATNKVIMRMFLALSASDMHRQGLVVRSPGRPTAEDHGRYHYSLAVKEFRQLLETPRRSVSAEELEIIFATMFLMVTYEWQFGHSVRHLQLHLDGVRSLLESHPQLFRLKDINDVFLSPGAESPSSDDNVTSRVSFIPEQFLLWILYIDASSRLMGLTESLYDYVVQSKNPALNPDHLHRCARLWGRCFWGEQYPDQQVLDDIENYRALELLHVGFCFRHRTWKVLVDPDGTSDTTESLHSEILSTRDKFSDLFITAKFAGPVSARRTLNTIYMAVSTLYAQIILHRRLLRVDSLPTSLHKQATAGIVDIARKQFASDPRLLRRLHWSLLMAVIETDDPTQRIWLRQRLFELRDCHSEYIWANEVADQILAQQELNPGCYANLAELLLQRLHVQ
ncbi:hypothetical protein F1880_003136 [Penicillium rolfsii]|nr:hypothetical protein F1880_003136 [Penicillium rolfsii]